MINKQKYTAGLDEAGRGCLAGPVVASAVIWPDNYMLEGLTDSKKLNEKKRDLLRKNLEDCIPPGNWAVGISTPKEIDEINILQATFLAMHRAIEKLTVKPHLLLIDGNRFKPYLDIPYRCEIKGDARFQAISAASIFAKTYRDQLMKEAHEKNPDYGWNMNKGYPSANHKEALATYGMTSIHRKTFKWKTSQVKINFPDNG
ncbi:MAG: Ribonuclease HII [Owenweeksia sp. TMED14]|nr:MAG: Ribonuclease HII [Owenweeksia sp. TMED14]